jgi:serine phosphatase RsbU (regulator of sigma subunit)
MAAIQPPGLERKILIIDHLEKNINDLYELFNAFSEDMNEVYSVRSVPHDGPVLNEVLHFKPDIIFLNFASAKGKGHSIIESLKNEDEVVQIPLILLIHSDSLSEIVHLGVTDFVRLPISREEVYMRTRNNLLTRHAFKEIHAQKARIEHIYEKNRTKTINLFGKNNDLRIAKKEINRQKNELEKQRDLLKQQNQEITGSIKYARLIQSAVFPPEPYINKYLNDFFILNFPRDIISGDFFWMNEMGNRVVVAVGDCTGHGVPGAFMSMLGMTLLNEIIIKNDKNILASDILNQLRDRVIYSLHQTGRYGEAHDGMDIALCILDRNKKVIEFAGANNGMLLIRNNRINIYQPDKMPVGFYVTHDKFTNYRIDYLPGDRIYMFTDGFSDQFGGPNGKKFKSKQFRELLLALHHLPAEKQKDMLGKKFYEWKGDLDQVDDVLIFGMRLE